ncbi:hypothetical protein SAMN05421505_11571 [Sinosporangium album]|uniref:Uncharacterized protein n=1 Tax=Sinosporangium album TaxID=504805 RepID=A0A1G8C7E8_9ACTN|nr:hypothetical protein [Sinosporangium album]SDH40790.1 hypothetical protein SAMN05421505_11571 [Sinosporangium album]
MSRVRIALAIAAGYYLGRHHKLRVAAALAAAGVAGGLGHKSGVLKHGAKILGSSPELEKITSRLRSDLTEVGKAAAVAAAGRQIDSLTSKLHDRAEALRQPGGRTEEEAEEKRPRRHERGRDEYEEYDEYEEGEYEEEPEGTRERQREPRSRAGQERSGRPLSRAGR